MIIWMTDSHLNWFVIEHRAGFKFDAMNMAREYSAVSNLEVRGFFVSRVKIALTIFVILLLLIILVTLGVLLAHEKGKDKSGQTRDEARVGGKRTLGIWLLQTADDI